MNGDSCLDGNWLGATSVPLHHQHSVLLPQAKSTSSLITVVTSLVEKANPVLIQLINSTKHYERSKSSGVVDNVIAESRRPFALLYFRILPLHFSKHKNSTKTNKTLPPAEGASEARADVNERKTSLEIVSISKYNSRGADQKYKLNCNGKAIMYCAKNLNNHVMPRGLP
ncbi:hypothetical protein J6590_006986 [Homalodisca vitripennis]|nr:hypothetical protein J6590_006986 [Homalodisca vitripennis]